MRQRLAVLLAGLALGGCFADTAARGNPEVRVQELETGLAAGAPGALELEAALVLNSDDSDFGGLSGLWLSPRSDRLIAASDRGILWTAALAHDDQGRLRGIQGWRSLMPRVVPGDDPDEIDAESLAGDRDGGLVIAYEDDHRLRRLPLDDLGAEPAVLPTPPIPAGTENAGIEALTDLAEGALLALSEGVTDRNGDLAGWLIRGERPEALGYVRTGDFVPTGIDRLDDVLFVVERRFNWLGGFATRIVALPADDAVPGARLGGVELARIERPLIGENFEGIVARHGPDGRIHLYLLSDDNFFLLQQTILLQLSIGPEALERRLGQRIAAAHQRPEG